MVMRNRRVRTAVTWLSMPRLMLLIASFRRYVLRFFARPHANSTAIIAKKTGVARTMIWLGLMRADCGKAPRRALGDSPECESHSRQRAARVHPDDLVDHAVAQSPGHADHHVVQVDRRVAVPRHQPQHAADGGHAVVLAARA